MVVGKCCNWTMKDDLESGGNHVFSDLKLFALSSNQELAQACCSRDWIATWEINCPSVF